MTDDSKDIIEQELNKAINFLGQNKFLDAEGICNKIIKEKDNADAYHILSCLLYTSPSPRDKRQSRMPSSA